MRLYFDQMLHRALVQRAREQGNDVVHASEIGEDRADDRQILERAIADGRILVTLDKHFGDWAVLPLSEHAGVVRVRVHPATNDNIAAILFPFPARHPRQEEYRNRLVIVSAAAERWIRTDVEPSGDATSTCANRVVCHCQIEQNTRDVPRLQIGRPVGVGCQMAASGTLPCQS